MHGWIKFGVSISMLPLIVNHERGRIKNCWLSSVQCLQFLQQHLRGMFCGIGFLGIFAAHDPTPPPPFLTGGPFACGAGTANAVVPMPRWAVGPWPGLSTGRRSTSSLKRTAGYIAIANNNNRIRVPLWAVGVGVGSAECAV